MKQSTEPLFRVEATQALQSRMSEALIDPKLRGSMWLTLLLVMLIFTFMSTLFVKVALGVTGHGVISMRNGSIPVIAERSGLLTEVISQRDSVTIQKGDVVARIRNLDLVTLRQAPNVAFSVSTLGQRRQRIEEREAKILDSLIRSKRENDIMEKKLISLSGETEELLSIFQKEIHRQEVQFQHKSELLMAGLILKNQVELVE